MICKQIDATVSILANAFVTKPLHVSAFGPQRIDQNRLFSLFSAKSNASGTPTWHMWRARDE